MAPLNADVLAARNHLQSQGWISRRSEPFRHLPPPALERWLGPASDDAPARSGWTLQPMGQTSASHFSAQWLDALDAGQRAALFDGLPAPGDGEAAPLAWAHRALCRHGLRLRVQGAPGQPAAQQPTVWLQLAHQPQSTVEAPLLVIDVAEGARCVLLETHESAGAQDAPARVQNLQAHVRLAPGATLQHLRVAAPQAGDDVAHHLHITLAEGAHYAQALIATDASYHLQRCDVRLQGAGAEARHAGLMLAGRQAIDQQVYSHLDAARTRSQVDMLALAGGGARAVANSYTRIASGADDADVHQMLKGIALGASPRIVLRPHLEILHDQVQAVHGATWGALPEDALFYARQRGLDEATARRLIIEGMAHAVLESCLGTPEDPEQPGPLLQWLDSGWLARAIDQHLHPDPEPSHG